MGKHTGKYHEPEHGRMGRYDRQREPVETNGNKQNNDNGNHITQKNPTTNKNLENEIELR